MERVMGIDYGMSKVGIAVNDELNITAMPITTIMHKGNEKLLFSEIEKYIKQYNIAKIVVGMPINMNGSKGERVEATEKFIQKIIHKFKIEVDTIDERLTTMYSNRILNELGVKSKKKKKVEDTMAAVYILQNYIDKTKNYGIL
ncbi:MAG: Holliday junction resolvase RuvX [Clostridiales bacterium]|nr:Holliday junction resolvase RuvX [Clostridiales bacterium]